jgi:hypothetical protein
LADLVLRTERAEYGGYLYVLLFDNGTVKLGCSANPGRRIESHRGNAEGFGIEALRVWISPLHDDYIRTEKELIAQAEMLGGKQIRKEYFAGVDFAAVVTAARRITYPPVDVAAHEARAARPNVFVEFVKSGARRGAPPNDPNAVIGALFGRRADGGYDLPDPDRDQTIPLDLIYKMSELTGEDVDDILAIDWTELRRRMLYAVVDCHAAELKYHILTTGRHDLRLPLEAFIDGDLLDDPEFDTASDDGVEPAGVTR